jgi:TPR repeat protein
MTDREKLPAVIKQQVVVHTGQRGSLVMRGLVAAQERKGLALAKDNDALYRQARDAYNRNTQFGKKHGVNELWSTGDAEWKMTFDIFQRLANNNYGEAYYPLSDLYPGNFYDENSLNKSRHFSQLALEWCLANQTNQDVEVWCDWGRLYDSSYCKTCVADDFVQCTYWYRKAAELGDRRGQWELGWVMWNKAGGDDDAERQEALSWMSKAVEQGNADLQCELGGYYVMDSQFESAAYWYRKAAEQGDSFAQWKLGEMYSAGRGVEQSDEQAVYWFRKAAERGLPEAQFKLGVTYYDAPQRDYEQARYWYRKAAEQGHLNAQLFLGEMYEDGRGVKDDEQAAYWFLKAAEQGMTDAKVGLKRLGIDWGKDNAS